MEKVIRYQIWQCGECDDKVGDLYNSLEDAISDCLNIYPDATEIEMLVWDSEELYEDYEPANDFETVWKRN